MANTNMRIIVLRASQYNFTDDNKNQVSGCKIHYIAPDMPITDKNTVGYSIASATLPSGEYLGLSHEVPAIYDGHFNMMIGSNGQAILKLKDITYVSRFPVQDLYNIALGEKGFEVPV